jgi:RNA polymerase sigma-70 factor, ECF subfamily
VSTEPATRDHGAVLVARYDEALPEVYGYLVNRCRDRTVAEDLTAETFMAAVDSIRRQRVDDVTVAWLIGIARHKLVDHWRRAERDRRHLDAVAGADTRRETPPGSEPAWDVHLDDLVVRDALERLGVDHRTALTLRYVDDLPVPRVAEHLDRTVHATEALLVRARRQFRSAYERLDPERGAT